jgi:hypothetical protein
MHLGVDTENATISLREPATVSRRMLFVLRCRPLEVGYELDGIPVNRGFFGSFAKEETSCPD